MGDELYVVIRASQEAADIEQLLRDINKISNTIKKNPKAQITIKATTGQEKDLTRSLQQEIQTACNNVSKQSTFTVVPQFDFSSFTEQFKKAIQNAENQTITVNVKYKEDNSTQQQIQQRKSSSGSTFSFQQQRSANDIVKFIETYQREAKNFTKRYQLYNYEAAAQANSQLETDQQKESYKRIYKFIQADQRVNELISQYFSSSEQEKEKLANSLLDGIAKSRQAEQGVKSYYKDQSQTLNDTQSRIESMRASLSARMQSGSSDDAYNMRLINMNNELNEINAQVQQIAKVDMFDRDNINLERLNQQAAELQKRVQSVDLSNTTAQADRAYKAIINRMDRYVNTNTKIRDNESLMQSYTEIRQDATNRSKSIAELRSAEQNLRNEAYRLGLAGQTGADMFTGQIKKFTQWFSVSQMVMGIVTQIRRMYEAVKDVDTAMTELKKVTDETDSSYQAFLDDAIVRARDLGSRVSDLVNATADFSRVGYDIETASAYADAATVYKNVGDGIEDINEASESIISTTKAFGDELQEPMEIVDKFNEVGNRTAISSQGIGEALKRSASALAAAGNDLNKSIGLIVAANSVVQDPDVVGTGLKTMSMRIRGASTEEMEAEGLDTDGMAESVSKLREELIALSGVDIMIDDTTFKSTYDIMVELSQVWDNLSDITQANIIEKIAGKRQGNIVASMMENMSDGIDAVGYAANSSGSALAENERYLDSVSGKLDKISANYESLATKIMNSEMLKDLLDFGDALLSGANKMFSLVDSWGLLFSLLISGVPSLLGFKTGLQEITDQNGKTTLSFQLLGKSISDIAADLREGQGLWTSFFSIRTDPDTGLNRNDIEQLQEYIDLYRKEQKNIASADGKTSDQVVASMSDVAQSWIPDLQSGAQTVDNLAHRFHNLSKAAKIGKAALVGLSQVGVFAAVTLITSAISSLITKVAESIPTFENLKEKATESMSAYEESKSQLESMNDELSTTQERIKELQSLGTLSVTEKSELEELKAKNQELQQRIALEEQIQKITQKTASEDALKAYQAGEFDEEFSKIAKKRSELEAEIETIRQAGYDATVEDKMLKGIDEEEAALIAELQELYSEINDIFTLDQLLEFQDTEAGKQLLQQYIEDMMIVAETAEEKFNLLTIHPEYQEFFAQAEELGKQNQLTSSTVEELINNYSGLEDELNRLGITVPNLVEQFSQLSEETSSISESLGLDELQSSLDTLDGYIEEYNSNGSLSPETVQSMLTEHPEYVKYLTKEGSLYKLNTDALNDYQEATAARDTLLDELVQKTEESVYGTKEFASGIVESFNEIRRSQDISPDIWNSLGLDQLQQVNQAFVEGAITAEEYFSSLNEYSNSIDFSAFENKTEAMSQGVQTVLSEMFVSITQGMQYVARQFNSGVMSFEDYYDSILTGAQSLSSYGRDVSEAAPTIEDTSVIQPSNYRISGGVDLKGLSDNLVSRLEDGTKAQTHFATSVKETSEEYEKLNENVSEYEEVIQKAEDLDYFVDFLNEQADVIEKYINESGDLVFPSPDVEGYQEFSTGLTDILNQAGQGSVLFTAMARAAEEATGQTEGSIKTVDQLHSVWSTSKDALNASTKAASQEVSNVMSGLLTGASNVLRSIADIIANFSVKLNIKVEGSQSLTDGLFGGIKIPEAITISGEGSSELVDSLNMMAGSLDLASQIKEKSDSVEDIIQQANSKNKEVADIDDSETTKKVQNIADKLRELDEEEHLDKLKKSIEEVQLLIDQLSRTMDTLDLSLELTSETDFSARFDLYSRKFDMAVEKGKVLRDEFNRLANTAPQTADEAQELANRLDALGSEIQSNIKDIVEYRNELNRLNLDAVSKAVETMMEQLDRQSQTIEHDIDGLINGSMIDGLEPFSIDFLLPEIPEDALSRQRRENQEYEKEEQRHQEVINEIKQQALDMQYAKLAETREKERQNLAEQRAELQTAVAEDSATIQNAVTTTSNYTVSSFSQAGNSAGQSFVNNFNTTITSIVESGKELAMTFATSFATGLQSGNVIGAAIQAAISTGLSASGGLAANDVSKSGQMSDTAPMEFYANGHNKYGGTHSKDKGIDYAHPAGTPIPAAWGGRVIKVANLGNKSYGKYVTIASDDGKNHVYAHMIRQNAIVGQRVEKGQIIGYVGSTGKSTGPHVHVSNAWGTYIDTTGMATGGIVRPNEQTLVGEKGRELAKLPDGRIILLGAHGAELCDLPPATQIIDNKNTEEILKYTGNRIIGKKVSKYGNGNKSTTSTHNRGTDVPKFASGIVDPQWIALANQIQAKYGIPSSLTLAQLILESAWGTSNLARNANNYFGMKGTGTAGSYNGWQRYNSMAESFEAYAKNLTSGKYYNVSGLSSTDFNGWIDRIAETYAPNQNYAAKVKQLAASYNLTQYDQMVTSAVTTTVEAAEETKTAAEKARELVEKYTEIPQVYSKEFLLDYRDYAEKRANNLEGIEDMLKIDPDRARDILDAQREADIQKSYEMKVDMYTNAADKLKQNYQDLLAEFDKIKDTADVDVLQEYIEGLSEIQENLYDIDETLREAAHSLYLYATEHLENQLKLLNNQYEDASYRNNFNAMVRNYQERIKLYQEIMQKASEEADRIRMTGASEDADYIQECIDDWWEAYNAIRQYREELEDLADLQESNYKDTLSDFQQSYLDIFNNAISDLQHQKDNDPVLQSLYDQRDALEKVNEERQTELALMRAKENLAKLQKTTLVYQKGVGWVYQADENALREAKENLNDAQFDYDSSKLDQQIEEREKFYDDQIEDIQKFIDNIEYEMEVYLRESATSIAEVMEILRELGVDTFENIEHITEWLDNLFSKINEDEYFKEHFGDLEGSYDEDRYYNLLKEMIYKERELSSLDADDEAERNRLRKEIDQIAELLGLVKQDGKYFTSDGQDAYEIGAGLIQDEIKDNTEQMKDSNSVQTALLESNNEILQNLYDFITQKDATDEQRALLEEMVQNSAKWADADEATRDKLHNRNVEIGEKLGLTYNEANGTWYTDDTQKMEAYAKIALSIMKANSSAWNKAETIDEKNFLHTVNSFLGKMFNLSYNASTGAWEYKNGLQAYAAGGVIDYSGYAEVHGGNASELVLNNADVAKLYEYIHASPNLIVSAIKNMSAPRIPRYNSPAPSMSYSFGNIYVQDVQNPNEFVKALKTELGTIIQREGLSIK